MRWLFLLRKVGFRFIGVGVRVLSRACMLVETVFNEIVFLNRLYLLS